MIKAITSRFLLEYDFKLQSGPETLRPTNVVHGDKILPNRDAIILFRRRTGQGSERIDLLHNRIGDKSIS